MYIKRNNQNYYENKNEQSNPTIITDENNIIVKYYIRFNKM